MEITRAFLESIAEARDINSLEIFAVQRYGDACIDRGKEIVVKSSDETDHRIEQKIKSKEDWHGFLDFFKK